MSEILHISGLDASFTAHDPAMTVIDGQGATEQITNHAPSDYEDVVGDPNCQGTGFAFAIVVYGFVQLMKRYIRWRDNRS